VRLLGPSRNGQLAAEVSRLSEARVLAVTSAKAERRRIERDFHDGLQRQLVSLALDLGLAKARIETDPGTARATIERAHEEAKRAATDLRKLVGGIHPSVLDERGIDAALSALVASRPVPVSVAVDLPRRPEATREAAAYFVVAEAITNVTRHSDAHRASVTIAERSGALHVAVVDDGHGGAHLDPGGGLAGLAARIASLDGTFSLSSPVGGPTRVEAVIPCEP
jgi:signal transduction histidine kinase